MGTSASIVTGLPSDILKTVAYFDLFDYPVTAPQIYRFLQRNSVTEEEVAHAADALVHEGRLRMVDRYFFLAGSDERIAAQRREGEAHAERMIRRAHLVARFLRHVPFVRGVFLTGSLSKAVADKDSDIDFMIVTSTERLWLVRSFLTLFRKVFLLGSKRFFCTNLYVTENGYPQQPHNLYTAVEVVTTTALWNDDALNRFYDTNRWTGEFLPNHHGISSAKRKDPARRSRLQILLEHLLSFLPLRTFDQHLMELHRRHWSAALRHVPDERRRTMLHISPDISACWPEDRQVPVLTRYREKLSSLGLVP